MDERDRTFIGGRANPDKFGLPVRSSSGEEPEQARLEEVTRRLGRSVFQTDAEGYECEIIGGAINPAGGIALLESRAKEIVLLRFGSKQDVVDVSIYVHRLEPSGISISAPIESYNPFFGCDVRFFEWIDGLPVLIYREKHGTFACSLAESAPPRFVKIPDDWVIEDRVPAYIREGQEVVERLRVPELEALQPISIGEATNMGLRRSSPES